MTHRIELGRRGETLAAEHLARLGHRVLDRNWRCAEGELDLVTELGRQIVVVEVKTRSSTGAGHPFEAITPIKLRRLHRLGVRWCVEHDAPVGRLRIDVVGIVLERGAEPVIDHLEGVRA